MIVTHLRNVIICLVLLVFGTVWCSAGTSAAYFGASVTNAAAHWPSVSFGTLRSLNAYPAVGWADINTSRGVYKWSNLDKLVSLTQSRGVSLVFTFARTPAWASSKPTGYCKNTFAGSCYPPSNQQYWKEFVAAISVRYAGKIKYWELWNEPNSPNSWSGTTAQMVTMAQSAYPIIKASSPTAVVLTPGPQGSSAYKWIDSYLAAGGGAYANAISFHGYLGATSGVANPPENILSIVANIKSVMSRHGLGSTPLWDTEYSWHHNSDIPNEDQQAAWLARHMILSWSSGVARSIWYAWDTPDQGTLWDKVKGMHKAGRAYGELYKWLVGATLNTRCFMATNYTWTCVFIRANGQQGQIMWRSSGVALPKLVPGQFNHYRDLAGNVFAIPATQSLTIGFKPILLLTPGIF